MTQDWNFTTVPQPGYNGRSIPFPRGHVLGGSTSISESSSNDMAHVLICMVDYMAYTRGSKDDYDRWARVTDDEGWSWNSLFPYMLKVKIRHVLPLSPHFLITLRWKDLLNPSSIEIHQVKLIPRCMGIPVRPLAR